MTDGRPLAPFGRRSVAVTDVRSIGAYTVIDVNDPQAPVARPGQFHMLAADGRWGGKEDQRPWLPRAISFLGSDGEGSFSFLVDPVGPGTRSLCEVAPGGTLLVAGPFGNGFGDLPAETDWVLVGGGIGVAPVAAQAQALRAKGQSPDLILGFRSAPHAEVASLCGDAIVSTDDGSTGRHGSVLGPMVEALDRTPGAVVAACGPPAMLEAVRAETEARGVRCLLALESPMACGFGACFGCAVETRSGTIRLCVDGPVVDAAELVRVAADGRNAG